MLDMLIITTSHLLTTPKATLRNGERGELWEHYMILCYKHSSPPTPNYEIHRQLYNLNSTELVCDKKTQGKLNKGEYIYKIALRSP